MRQAHSSIEARRIDEDGYLVSSRRVDAAELDRVAGELDALTDGPGVRSRRGSVFAIRNLLDLCRPVVELARSGEVRAAVTDALGDGWFAVRATLIDKRAGANWAVGWHQDLTIAVRRRADHPGFERWSVKEGVDCVQPPADVLAAMVAVRVHLDPCDERSGALRVLPGSHATGRLDGEALAEGLSGTAVTVPVERGGILLMRPLLLHASSHRSDSGRRRVIHFEFAREELPGGLEWRHAVR